MDTNTIDVHNVIKTSEAKEILTNAVKSLISSKGNSNKFPAIIFRGSPGCGKSTIVREVAESLDIGFIDVRLAQMERCDLCGIPSVVNGTTIWNVPSFWPSDPNSKGILFFDEITAAPGDTQIAAYSLILDRKIPNSNYKLPDGWYIIAAGNRKEDRAVAKTMSSALANRFMHFELKSDAEDWCEWAIQHDLHPAVTGYINYRPANLFKMQNENIEGAWPSPRSWERVSQIIPIFNYNEDTLRKAVYGLIGPGVGVEFFSFYNLNAKMDNALEMLTNPKAPIVIPEKSDQKYALCSAIAYLLWNGDTLEEHTRRISGMYRVVMNMSTDFASLLVKLCISGNSQISKIQAITMIRKDPAYKAFSEKFGEAFTKKYSLDLNK